MTRRASRPALAVTLLATAWVVVLAAGTLLGEQPIHPGDLLALSPQTAAILWQLRLPRVLLGLLGGAALALSGLALQTLFRNPLAEPYTLGVASGGALGAVLAIQLGGGAVLGLPWVAAAAFAGALAVGLLVLGLAGSRFGSEGDGVLLAGIAISLTCSAFILFVEFWAERDKTLQMVHWMMGSLEVVDYGEALWLAPWVVAGTAALLLLRWELNLLLTGEEIAASRGVDLVRLRLLVLGITSLMVGALVAVAGPIGFVGLMVPHLLRRGLGHDHLLLAPACALGGGVFLAASDLVARSIVAPAELPVGVVTAMLGGPFFLWLLLRRRRA